MARKSKCRLCLFMCDNFLKLYDETGDCNKRVYEIAATFFDAKFLTQIDNNERTLVCLECWHHIFEFHKFQKKIILVQEQLLDKTPSQSITIHKNPPLTLQQLCTTNDDAQPNVCNNPVDASTCEDLELLIKANVVGGIKGDFISEPKLEIMDDYDNENIITNATTDLTESSTSMTSSIGLDNSDSSSGLVFLGFAEESTFGLDSSALEVVAKEETAAYNLPVVVVGSNSEMSKEFATNLKEAFTFQDMPIQFIENEISVNNRSVYSNSNSINALEITPLADNSVSMNTIVHEESINISSDESSNDEKSKLYVYDSDGQSDEYEDEIGIFEGGEFDRRQTTDASPMQFDDPTISEHNNDSLDDEVMQQQIEKPKNNWNQLVLSKSAKKRKLLCKSCKKSFQDLEKHSLRCTKNRTSFTISSSTKFLARNAIGHRKPTRLASEVIAEWKSLLDCPLCSGSFSSFLQLSHHFHIGHDNNKPYILCCKRKFYNERILAVHSRRHATDEPNATTEVFQCEICNQSYNREIDLRKHFEEFHAASDSSPPSVANHVSQQNATTAAFQCQICDQSYNREIQLRMHVLECHAASNSSPPPAAAKQETENDFNSIIAERKQIFDCPLYCGSFSSFMQLKQHFETTHPSEKPYIKCCKTKFYEERLLADHAKVHLAQTRFSDLNL